MNATETGDIFSGFSPYLPSNFPRNAGAGLVLPYAAQAIMGKGGAAAVLLLMFMSCTSAISAQLIGVSTGTCSAQVGSSASLNRITQLSRTTSSRLTCESPRLLEDADLTRYSSQPGANDRTLLKASHLAVVGFSLWMAGFASMLHGASIDLGFI